MSDITVREICPHCGGKTPLWFGTDDSIVDFDGCVHCGEKLKDLSWRKKAWSIVRELEPKKLRDARSEIKRLLPEMKSVAEELARRIEAEPRVVRRHKKK